MGNLRIKSGHMNLYKFMHMKKTNTTCFGRGSDLPFLRGGASRPTTNGISCMCLILPGVWLTKIKCFLYRMDPVAIVPGPYSDPSRIQIVSYLNMLTRGVLTLPMSKTSA